MVFTPRNLPGEGFAFCRLGSELCRLESHRDLHSLEPKACGPGGFFFLVLQYHHQIGSIGSEQEKALYSSCFFTDEKRQYTDENDEQAGWQVEGDG